MTCEHPLFCFAEDSSGEDIQSQRRGYLTTPLFATLLQWWAMLLLLGVVAAVVHVPLRRVPKVLAGVFGLPCHRFHPRVEFYGPFVAPSEVWRPIDNARPGRTWRPCDNGAWSRVPWGCAWALQSWTDAL